MPQNSRFQKKSPKASSRTALAAVVLIAASTGLVLPWRSSAMLTVAQERGPAPTSAPEIRSAIDRLADIDYAARSKAARVVRRAEATQAVPALQQAIAQHKDGLVRFKSLVLLTGFNDSRAVDEMRTAL